MTYTPPLAMLFVGYVGGRGPAVSKAVGPTGAGYGYGWPTPVGGWELLHSGSCRRLYRLSVERGLRVYRVGGVSLAVFPTNPLPHLWCWVVSGGVINVCI